MNWKKVVSVLLIGTMAFSMMACGGKDNSSSNDAKNDGTQSASSEEVKLDDKLVVWTLSNDLIDFGKRLLSGYRLHPVQLSIRNQRYRLRNPVLRSHLSLQRILHHRNPQASVAHQRLRQALTRQQVMLSEPLLGNQPAQ